MDPRKPVQRVDPIDAQAYHEAAYPFLLDVTQRASQALGMNGISFVILATTIWMNELTELDRRAAEKMIAAILVILDPSATSKQKQAAERRRRAAAVRLFAAVDLDMANPEGRA